MRKADQLAVQIVCEDEENSSWKQGSEESNKPKKDIIEVINDNSGLKNQSFEVNLQLNIFECAEDINEEEDRIYEFKLISDTKKKYVLSFNDSFFDVLSLWKKRKKQNKVVVILVKEVFVSQVLCCGKMNEVTIRVFAEIGDMVALEKGRDDSLVLLCVIVEFIENLFKFGIVHHVSHLLDIFKLFKYVVLKRFVGNQRLLIEEQLAEFGGSSFHQGFELGGGARQNI